MNSTDETADLFRRELGPYVKPRQEVEYIRKVLALHLQDSISGPELESPISLVDESSQVTVPPDMTGLYKEYLEALDVNLQAIATFQKLRSQILQPLPAEVPLERVDMNAINDQIAFLKLKQKEERLLVLDRYLDELSEKPAIQEGFLQLNEIFRNLPALPQVPEEIINGVIVGQNSGPTNSNVVKERLAAIDKEIMKQKLLLRREEKLLEAARSLSPVNPDRISEARKRHALNATRNELIMWIETELSKASGDGQNGDDRRRSSGTHQSITTEKIAGMVQEVKDKYAEYTTRRNDILGTMGKIPVLEKEPSLEVATETSETPLHLPGPISHLMIPYLNQLFELARLQKSIIAQKAHLSGNITNKGHEGHQALDRLAEESRLLPMYPMGISGTIEDEATSASSRVAEWAYAAEAAKLTSLEATAEQMELSQMALEETQMVFDDIQKALKLELNGENEAVEVGTSTDDIWIEAAKNQDAQQHNKKDSKAKGEGWSRIHGKLGLIGQDM